MIRGFGKQRSNRSGQGRRAAVDRCAKATDWKFDFGEDVLDRRDGLDWAEIGGGEAHGADMVVGVPFEERIGGVTALLGLCHCGISSCRCC